MVKKRGGKKVVDISSSPTTLSESMEFFSLVGALKVTVREEKVFSVEILRNSGKILPPFPPSHASQKASLFDKGDSVNSVCRNKRRRMSPLLCEVRKQLDAYFRKKLKKFDLPLAKRGGLFDEKVREALKQIPFGCVFSYYQLALQVGKPKSYRSVGGSCGRNPFLIVVPCHRVINKSGALGGFSAGLSRKKKLLTLEGSFPVKCSQILL